MWEIDAYQQRSWSLFSKETSDEIYEGFYQNEVNRTHSQIASICFINDYQSTICSGWKTLKMPKSIKKKKNIIPLLRDNKC